MHQMKASCTVYSCSCSRLTSQLLDFLGIAILVSLGSSLGQCTLSHTASTPGDICVFVIDKKLAVLAIATGQLLRDLHDVEHICGLMENGIHLFQRPVGCLRVEEVHDWYDEGIARKALAEMKENRR